MGGCGLKDARGCLCLWRCAASVRGKSGLTPKQRSDTKRWTDGEADTTQLADRQRVERETPERKRREGMVEGEIIKQAVSMKL